jgi:hypothetical protein
MSDFCCEEAQSIVAVYDVSGKGVTIAGEIVMCAYGTGELRFWDHEV